MVTIKISEIIKDKKITKKSNAINIFNAMKGAFNKDSQTDGFQLDMAGIVSAPTYVFKEIIEQMQSKLNGQFRLELINANQFVAQSFRQAFK